VTLYRYTVTLAWDGQTEWEREIEGDPHDDYDLYDWIVDNAVDTARYTLVDYQVEEVKE